MPKKENPFGHIDTLLNEVKQSIGGESTDGKKLFTKIDEICREINDEADTFEQKRRAIEFIEAGNRDALIQNFENFPGIKPEDHKEIALKLIEAGNRYALAGYLKYFQESIQKITKKLH